MSLFASLFSRWLGPPRPALDPDAFTQMCRERLHARLPAAAVEVLAPLALAVEHGDERGQIFLDNAFRLACQAVDDIERGEVIDRFLAALVDGSGSAAEGIDDIVPVLKPSAWFDGLARPEDGSPSVCWTEPLAADMAIVYAVDTPDQLRFVTEPWFVERGIPLDGLLRRAVGNLRAKIPKLEVQRGGGVNLVIAGGVHEAAILLFDDFWARETPRLRGDPVIAIPARDVLVFGDSSDARALAELRRYAQDIHADAAYALSPRLLRRHADGRIEPFDEE